MRRPWRTTATWTACCGTRSPQGLEPMTAIQMMTINAAEHFGLAREMGMIAPGRWADIVLAKDLKDFQAELVIAKGQVVAENGKWKVELPSQLTYPAWATNSVHLKRAADRQRFCPEGGKGRPSSVTANVIGVIENQAPTRHLTFEVQPEDGEVKADISRDMAKIAVVQRHQGHGRHDSGPGQRLRFHRTMRGRFDRGARLPSYAGGRHGRCRHGDRGQQAGGSRRRPGGGEERPVIGLVELAIGGLMSTERAEVVAKKAATVLAGSVACGCKLNNPNMQLSLLALVVIPELRISDKGLVDVTKFDFVPVLQSLPAGPEPSLPRRKSSKSLRGRENEATKKA